MSLETFIAEKSTCWQEFENLLKKKQRLLHKMSTLEVERLGALYRQVTSDLAIAQRDHPSERVTLYLNQLSAKGHSIVYQGQPMEWRAIFHFYLWGFPQAYREILPYTIVSFLISLVSGLLFYFLTLANPGIAEHYLSPDMIATIQQHQMWTNIDAPVRSIAASGIMSNNIQVAITAFAYGITFGIGTIWVLFNNGIMLGIVAAYCQIYGLSLPLWTFVVSHGFIELSVIFMAGGAGLMLGDSILRPGLLSRGESLYQAALKSIKILFGGATLLVISGIIEGFLSPSGVPAVFKLVFGLTTGVLLYSYLFLAHDPGINTKHSVLLTMVLQEDMHDR